METGGRGGKSRGDHMELPCGVGEDTAKTTRTLQI